MRHKLEPEEWVGILQMKKDMKGAVGRWEKSMFKGAEERGKIRNTCGTEWSPRCLGYRESMRRGESRGKRGRQGPNGESL